MYFVFVQVPRSLLSRSGALAALTPNLIQKLSTSVAVQAAKTWSMEGEMETLKVVLVHMYHNRWYKKGCEKNEKWVLKISFWVKR